MGSVDTSASRELARRTAGAAAEKKASEIRLLEVGELLAIADFFVLCSAANPRQMDVIAEEVEQAASAAGYPATRREGELDSGWVVRDFGEVVVHVFTEDQRRVYDLERLWREAPAEDYGPAETGPTSRPA
ncbi:MAG: ribosome silencing factor [Actinobacteria bacterium QS_8_72_14]|nr:MAG: ribosome silencing factor [Actinobacteria bacterium QS_8_72_14]